jgi:hypothetical protein
MQMPRSETQGDCSGRPNVRQSNGGRRHPIDYDAGDVAGAETTLAGIKSNLRPYYVLFAIATAQAKTGDHDGAAAMIARLAPDFQAEGYATLAAVQSAAPARARANVARALDAATKLTGPHDRAEAYRLIAVAQARGGELKEAKASYIEALVAAAKLKNGPGEVYWKSDVLADIGISQVSAGDLDGARATASLLVADWLAQARVCHAIAMGRARVGESEAAALWAESQAMPLSRVFAYAGLVEGLFQPMPPDGPDATRPN